MNTSGSSIVDMEAEQEEENETSKKTKRTKNQENTEVYLMRKEESSALPATPMSIYRYRSLTLKGVLLWLVKSMSPEIVVFFLCCSDNNWFS